jgi:hypothetical protein
VVVTTTSSRRSPSVAANFGMPDVRTVIVDHPLGGTDEATIVDWADAAVERVISLFTGAR